MEKKEARIKCTGCGTSYKIKIPITDKPVSFTCKKCGKVLKLRIKAASAPEAPPIPARLPELETSQLPDPDMVPAKPEQKIQKSPSFVDTFLFPGATPPEEARRWIVLSDDLIKGPFTGTEIVHMIENREVTAGTSLRMGERPWIKAEDTPDFKAFFESERGQRGADLGTLSPLDKEGRAAADKAGGKSFQVQWSSLLRYPPASGDPKPLIIFFGIAFVLSIILVFPLMSSSILELTLRVCLNLAGWIVLYGYLAELMSRSMQMPDKPPPAWDFSKIKQLAVNGLKVLAVILTYWFIPVLICSGLTVFAALNSMQVLSYLLIAVTILVFFAFLCVVGAALAILAASGDVGRALNPSMVIGTIQKAGGSYPRLAIASMALGAAVLLCVVLAVVLTEIPTAGFIVAAFVMALGSSYCFFVWFHALGLFSAQIKQPTGTVVTGGSSDALSNG
jgi:hypothetical protein